MERKPNWEWRIKFNFSVSSMCRWRITLSQMLLMCDNRSLLWDGSFEEILLFFRFMDWHNLGYFSLGKEDG